MKICIIGAGTASAVALLQIFEIILDKNMCDVEVVCIYDPIIPVTHVGESTGPWLPLQLFKVIDFFASNDMSKFDGTLRWGNKYQWINDFFISHGSPGMHVNSEKFSFYVINKLEEIHRNFKSIQDSVTNIIQNNNSITVSGINSEYQVDYLIDCRGTPTQTELDSNLYSKPNFIGVNSVILYPDFKDYNEDFTSMYIHNNGWMFGVPLTHRKAFGYLYNNQITSEQEARTDFEKIKNIDTSSLRQFSWQQYYRKVAVEGNILYLGNKLFFFEPSGAIPLFYYMALVRQFFSRISSNETFTLEETINRFHSNNIDAIQDLVAINYVGENSIESNFWINAKKESFVKLQNSKRFVAWARENVGKQFFTDYWRWDGQTMKKYVNGYNIDLTKFLN